MKLPKYMRPLPLSLKTKTFLSLFLITVLTSFLQSYLDKIRKEEMRRHAEGGFMQTIKQIGRFFKTIGKKLKNVSKGFAMVGAGLYDEVIGIGKTGELLVDNTVKVATCVGKKIENYGKCSKYYFLDVIGDMVYGFFVTLPLFITKLLSGIDLFPFEKGMLEYVNYMDNIFRGSTGFSMKSYPDSVLDLCYRCVPELPNQKEQNEKIVGYLEKPINDMGDGFKKVFSIFS